jgi:hypothetical protein
MEAALCPLEEFPNVISHLLWCDLHTVKADRDLVVPETVVIGKDVDVRIVVRERCHRYSPVKVQTSIKSALCSLAYIIMHQGSWFVKG